MNSPLNQCNHHNNNASERESIVNLNHKAFKKLARLNGKINSLNIDQIKNQLKTLNLESCGSMESCKKRLKHHFRNEVMSKCFKKQMTYYYDVVCVVDFEATCDKEPSQHTIQEIIEFPAFMVDLKQKKIISTFHEFVKPRLNTQLSEFCTQLTGITQDVVDKADHFPQVLDRFENWFYTYLKNNNTSSFALATDGPWDMSHFLASQCEIDKIPFPAYSKRWINIRKVFSSHYKTQHLNLDQMLAHLGMQFQGRKHCGYDDALNIANILIRMTVDGANPVINERISWHQCDRQCWYNLKYGYVRVFYNKPHDGLNVSDSEDSITDSDEIAHQNL